MTQPQNLLAGVKVIDLTSVVFGPYCTNILADLGAEVIKVEAPQGDIFRYSTKPNKTRGMSAGHLTLNRGKQSLVLDLKEDQARAQLLDLLQGADVFIHNVRADAIERLGLGYDAVKAVNPEVIYTHCVGFGSDGPYAGLPAYDDVIQAATGTATLFPRVTGDPTPRYIPSLIADKVAGLHGAYAVMAAYIHKLRTGHGQFVEVPMFECFASFILKEHLAAKTFDPPNGPICYPRQIDPDRQPFPTADGHLCLVAYTDASWIRLFELMEDSDYLDDERFSSPIQRVRNINLLYQRIATNTVKKTTAEWVAILREANIPAMPARDMSDILEDPHLAETFFRRREHPTEGPYFEMRQPVRFGSGPLPDPTPAPGLGEHTDEILKD